MASINKKKLADSVIEEIKRMIQSGELNEGGSENCSIGQSRTRHSRGSEENPQFA